VADFSEKDLKSALEAVGIETDDLIYVSSSLFQLGQMTDAVSKTEYCRLVLEACKSVIGSRGTIVAPCFTPQTGRFGEAFDPDKSPSQSGMLPEYIRHLGDAIRSVHPLHSVVATGHDAKDICADIAANSSAIDSVAHRLYLRNAKAVTLGASRPLGAWVHLIEFLTGVPYKYNKLLDVDVFVSGKKLSEEFFAHVCFRDFGIKYNTPRVERLMIDEGFVTFEPLGRGRISSYEAGDCVQFGLNLLRVDPYAYLKKNPAFRHGEIPYDGPVG